MSEERGNWKAHNVKAILNNVEKVFKTNNIDLLSKPAYSFIMNIHGFIAHYDLSEFKQYYSDLRELITELDNAGLRDDQEWYGNAYNKSVADIKSGLNDLCKKYRASINSHFSDNERQKAVETVRNLVNEYHIDIETELKYGIIVLPS